VVARRGKPRAEVEITQARESGEKLAADNDINLPYTQLDLRAMTDKVTRDLVVAAQPADMIGLSFAQSADDVNALHTRLTRLDALQLALVLKIESRRGFEHLPEMLMAAVARPTAGVMIARGDLAVEYGHERVAEVQEEILWACEACLHASDLDHAGAGLEGPHRSAFAIGDHGCGDGRARRMRDAEQRAIHCGRDAQARRHPAPHGDPPAEEASAAAGVAQLGCPHSNTYRDVKDSPMLVPILRRQRRSGLRGCTVRHKPYKLFILFTTFERSHACRPQDPRCSRHCSRHCNHCQASPRRARHGTTSLAGPQDADCPAQVSQVCQIASRQGGAQGDEARQGAEEATQIEGFAGARRFHYARG